MRIGWALSLDIVACVSQAVGIGVLANSGSLTAQRALLVVSVSAAVATAMWFAWHRHAFRFDRRLVRADLKADWNFAKWIFASAIAWQSATYLYPWLLAACHGVAAAGVWAACSSIVASANPVLLGLNNYVSPKIAGAYAAGGNKALGRTVRRSSAMVALLLSPFVLALAIGGDRIMAGVYGDKFTGTSGVVLALAVNMLVGSFSFSYAQGLFNLNRAKTDMSVNLVSIGLLFGIGTMVVSSYGPLGAAMALLASGSISAVIRAVLFWAALCKPAASGPPPKQITPPAVHRCQRTLFEPVRR
jgi:O-antigen/teichoic acid export membrane protein